MLPNRHTPRPGANLKSLKPFERFWTAIEVLEPVGPFGFFWLNSHGSTWPIILYEDAIMFYGGLRPHKEKP